MKTTIYCRTTDAGVQSFYICHEGEVHYLFSQNYRRSVRDYYARGVSVERALSYSRAGENVALRKVTEKLPAYIRYIEKEYGIAVLEQTRRREAQRMGEERCRTEYYDRERALRKARKHELARLHEWEAGDGAA
jgi:hypothetical protein